jgi:hypothetical protein
VGASTSASLLTCAVASQHRPGADVFHSVPLLPDLQIWEGMTMKHSPVSDHSEKELHHVSSYADFAVGFVCCLPLIFSAISDFV